MTEFDQRCCRQPQQRPPDAGTEFDQRCCRQPQQRPLGFLIAAALLFASCTHAPATKPAEPSGRPEETALKDAFSELVQFVHAHHDLFTEDDLPICVVLGDTGDPSDRTMMELKSAYRWVEPASSCPFKKRAVLIVAADGGEPLDDGRMIAHAGFSLGQHNGMSWAYRLEQKDNSWKIDARLESRNEMP